MIEKFGLLPKSLSEVRSGDVDNRTISGGRVDQVIMLIRKNAELEARSGYAENKCTTLENELNAAMKQINEMKIEITAHNEVCNRLFLT